MSFRATASLLRALEAPCCSGRPQPAPQHHTPQHQNRRSGGRRWARAAAQPAGHEPSGEPLRARSSSPTRSSSSSSGSASASAQPLLCEPFEAYPPGGSPAALLYQASELAAAAAGSSGAVAEVATPRPGRRQGPDHYRAAGQRLRSLLSGVGDGEDELLDNLLEEQPPAQKLLLCLAAGAAISGGAALACWLCGLDPLGGASLSPASLHAAAVGAAAALPLVAAKAALWSEPAARQLPFLDDVHRAKIDSFRPLVANLTPSQVAVLLVAEVIPGMLVLLPATAGGVAKAVEMYGGAAVGGDLPQCIPCALGLAVIATIAGLSKAAETSMSTEEYEIVKDALQNADRYYRVMVAGPSAAPFESQRAADAFRSVALTWMARNQVATRFAGLVGALEVLYLGILWQATGDLAAPLMAALGSASVDFAHVRRLSAPASKRGTA